jgi:ferredoxin
MQQNPYCSRCYNSLIIDQCDGKYIGHCDKCRIIVRLSLNQSMDYLHNEKCKTLCKCGGTAYVHNSDTYYHCLCCDAKIPLKNHYSDHLKLNKIYPNESKNHESKKIVDDQLEKTVNDQSEKTVNDQSEKTVNDQSEKTVNDQSEKTVNDQSEKTANYPEETRESSESGVANCPELSEKRGKRILIVQEPEDDEILYFVRSH